MASDPLSTVFGALSDPTRREMLTRLAGREMTVAELSAPIDLSPPSITKHLKVLERAGLVERGRNAQWRPCRLRAAPLGGVIEWVERFRPYLDPDSERVVGDTSLSRTPTIRPDVQPPDYRPDPEPESQVGIDESHW